MQTIIKKRIGILRGGAGEHYNSSLKKGGDIISYISENLADRYQPVDILIDKDYLWHINGLPVSASDLVNKIDVGWNFSHPSFSNILESLSIPHMGSEGFLGTLQNNRSMLREHMKMAGINMTRHLVLPVYQTDFDGPRERYAIKKAKEVFEKFGSPWIVKSFTPDANMGIHLAKTFPELVSAIEDGVEHENSILVEEFIPGKIASIHSVPHFRGQELYTFPLGNTFGDFTSNEREIMNTLVKNLRNHLGVSHYLKSDLVVNPRGKVYLLGVESSPNLKPDSHFSQVCELAGVKPHDVIHHILEQTLQ